MSGGSGKFGRCKNRPSNKRYTAQQRWVTNKKKAIARERVRVAKHKARAARRAKRAAPA